MEDKNDPSPSVENLTWRPSQRCSNWRVSASLVILFKVKDHVHSLVISEVRLKGKRASAYTLEEPGQGSQHSSLFHPHDRPARQL